MIFSLEFSCIYITRKFSLWGLLKYGGITEGANVSNHIENLKSKLKPSQISDMERLFRNGLYPNLVEEGEKRNPTLDINERRVPPYLDEK